MKEALKKAQDSAGFLLDDLNECKRKVKPENAHLIDQMYMQALDLYNGCALAVQIEGGAK